MKLTKVQSQTLDFVRQYIREHGNSPTLKELGGMRRDSGMGGHPTSVSHTLSQLRSKGLICFSEGKHRSITPKE